MQFSDYCNHDNPIHYGIGMELDVSSCTACCLRDVKFRHYNVALGIGCIDEKNADEDELDEALRLIAEDKKR